jgi:sigma-B regulation protein RsbU (phosphoserine phosphatase)
MSPLLAGVPCLLLVTDLHGKVHAASGAMATLVGHTPETLHGQGMELFLPPAGKMFMQTHVWPTLFSAGELLEGYLNLRPSQTPGRVTDVPVMFNAQVKGIDGRPLCHWVFFEVRGRSRFEEELISARKNAQKLSEDLARANAALETANQALQHKAATIEASNNLLAQLSQTDALTGVGNRRALHTAFDQWREAQASSATGTHQGSLLLVDADHFKCVNDSWGHDEGDRVLIALAQCLRASVRTTDHVSRFGGEEFVVWLPEATEEVAQRVTGNIHQRVQQIRVGQSAAPITVSIGQVSLSGHTAPQDLAHWLRLADQGVYEAKALGRNRTVVVSAKAPSATLPGG